MNIDQLVKKVIEFLARHPHQAFKAKEISRRLTIKDPQDYQLLKETLRFLEENKRIRRVRKGYFGHLEIPRVVQGRLDISKSGLGFVRVDGLERDIFIAPRFLGTALHGDIVQVSLFAQGKKKKENEARREGEIVRVVERSRTNIIGVLECVRKAFFVVSDDPRFPSRVIIPQENLLAAREGEKVVAEIESWGRNHLSPQGRIIEVLGKPGEVSVELRAVVREFQLPSMFPVEVHAEVQNISPLISEADVAKQIGRAHV